MRDSSTLCTRPRLRPAEPAPRRGPIGPIEGFGAAGALTAIEKRFALVGVLVLASVTAVGGGAIRDVLVGRLPPDTFRNEPLLWAVAATAVATFALHGRVRSLPRLLYALDGVGLAIFAALGASTGVSAGLGP